MVQYSRNRQIPELGDIIVARFSYNNTDQILITNPGINVFAKVAGTNSVGTGIRHDLTVSRGAGHYDTVEDEFHIYRAGVYRVHFAFHWQQIGTGAIADYYEMGVSMNGSPSFARIGQRSEGGTDGTILTSEGLLRLPAGAIISFWFRNTDSGNNDWCFSALDISFTEVLE